MGSGFWTFGCLISPAGFLNVGVTNAKGCFCVFFYVKRAEWVFYCCVDDLPGSTSRETRKARRPPGASGALVAARRMVAPGPAARLG